jgi:hypothetical protein
LKVVFRIGLFVSALTFLLAACQTDSKTAAAHFAAVELRGNTPGQIADIAIAVFKDHGFSVARRTYSALVFEKEASRMDNLAYGNWISDKPVWVRVRAEIVPVAEAHFRLQCHPVLVLDKNETMEEELKVKFRSGPYQKLLDEVALRLSGGPGPYQGK